MPTSVRMARALAVSLMTTTLAVASAHAQTEGPAAQEPPKNTFDPKSETHELPQGASRFLPIHIAAMKGDVLSIQDELDKGVEVDAQIEQGFFAGVTPLMMAARDADAATMKYLLDHGAKVNARDSRRVSVLMWASSTEGSVEKIDLALEHGAEVDPRSQDGATAIQWAAGLGKDPAMVQSLIKAGATIDIPDDHGRTPLMTAARVGNAGAVQYLLDAGADRARKSPQGLNALHWAAEGERGNADTIRALVNAGMAVDSRASDGSTPLIIAGLNGRADQAAELIALNADINATNSWGLTPLMAAASDGQPDALKSILDAHPDLNAQDQAGRVALHYSVAKGNGIATAMIARRAPDPNISDKDGWMPIHLARTMATLDPLVRAGADVDARCSIEQYADWTPLMFASASGNTFLARCLLHAGADPSLQAPKETNAMRIALAVQYPDGANPMADLIRDALSEKQAERETQESEVRRKARSQDPADAEQR